MSAIGSLTNFYGSFFIGASKFALSPYLLTVSAFMGPEKKPEDLLLGVGMCIFLSTVVPILPAIASITMALAGFAMSLALATMFVSYPAAIFVDAIDDCDTSMAPSY